MDVTFNNVLEGTRQYFMGLPKQAQAEGSGQPLWPAGALPTEEEIPAQSGIPTPLSRPSSATAGTVCGSVEPLRPPSEPLEPEPHIIHKATVMREAAEKRREQPEPEDEEEPVGALSPPTHIIRKPPQRALPSPAPANAAPCPSPARPSSNAPLPPTLAPESQQEHSVQYRLPVHRVQTPTARHPDHIASGRPPDAYSVSRPPESYARYHYDSTLPDGGRGNLGPPIASSQQSVPPRHSPQQTYARISTSMPQHVTARMRDNTSHLSSQRYIMPATQPPPHNDRVPPIHHPQNVPPTQRLTPVEGRSTQVYPPLSQCRESSPYARSTSQYDRYSAVSPRKYDPQQSYSGYRPSQTTSQPVQRLETHQVQYKPAAMDVMSSHYATRPSDRIPATPQLHTHDTTRLSSRGEYSNVSRTVNAKSGYHYATHSASTVRYAPSAPAPIVQNSSLHSRATYRPTGTPKNSYDYSTTSSHMQTSPVRSTVKSGFLNQQTRMTVSVTTLVNQMNQTKQKRESPLDLSVKTVKNSADSSTTPDDIVDSVSVENKSLSLQSRSSSSSRHISQPVIGCVASHKVDFAPDFTQYRERSASHSFNTTVPTAGHPPVRYNGSYEVPRPAPESYHSESRHQVYSDRSKYNVSTGRTDFVPRIDLTRSASEERHQETRIRDDRHFLIEERKRPGGTIVSNIPEKLVRYETWSADSRIERMNRSAREQHELMSRPVYSYSSHKRFEAFQNEQKRVVPASTYNKHHSHPNHRYTYPIESPMREANDYQVQYHDKNPSNTNRHVIQKNPSQRDNIHTQHLDPHNGIPADKSVLSILRNSLETKQTGFVESTKQVRQIPDLIVIDDVDDSVIEITDLTKDNDTEVAAKTASPFQKQINPHLGHHIHMPKAVDSIVQDSDYQKYDYVDPKSKSPENDVASRIRTKAELKVLPPSQDTTVRSETKNLSIENEKVKILPKSQKQHLFNQIREDSLRLESVIKNETQSDMVTLDVKTEPMNIDEIEKDAVVPIKSERVLENLEPGCVNTSNGPEEDLDWANACDNFVEQLKSGCHKKKIRRKRMDTLESENIYKPSEKSLKDSLELTPEMLAIESTPIIIKQEPVDEYEATIQNAPVASVIEKSEKVKANENKERSESGKEIEKDYNQTKDKLFEKVKSEITESSSTSTISIKSEECEKELLKTDIKEESESTDDDVPLIKSKLLKEKEQSERLKYQLLKDLSEKAAYVKLECCDVDMNKNSRKSIDSVTKEREEKPSKGKISRQLMKTKSKRLSTDNKNSKQKSHSSSDSDDDDDLSVASRLRMRKNIKSSEENKVLTVNKTIIKSSPSKKTDNNNTSTSSTPVRKPGFGDGSDFHPGWEEELFRYKRSIRMPPRLIAIPRGRSGGPFLKGSSTLFTRGSTSLPDLDPAPLSPAPSSVPSAATDDLYGRRPDKLTLDSDLDSNSSCSAVANRLHYDSEASTSTVISSNKVKKRGSSIVDVLIQKCGRKEDPKKKVKDKDDKTPKIIRKCSNTTELLPTPSLGLLKNGNRGSLNVKKEKLMEDIFYLGAFRKETVTAFRNAFIKNTDGLIGATEEFAPVVLKSRTRTESRVLKQRATIKEVFGDERPASAPPSSCREEDTQEVEAECKIKKDSDTKLKLKPKKIIKDKLKRRSSSIRDGLRSTKSLKKNDAKGRLLRLKKRNNLMSLANKKISRQKHKKSPSPDDKDVSKNEGSSLGTTEGNKKKRLKRLFGRRKFSSGFDYIRKKKKIIRREDSNNKLRRPTVKTTPESVHDIHKEIKGWFINKSIGETHLHRAARLGYTDCVAYCLEKMEADPSAKDNAGFTPLHVAAAKGHVRIARLLLQYGANVSAAAQGGIRPLHEASENCHVEVIRLLLAYGADPLLGTYSGQTPEELAEGSAATLLRLHIADVQGHGVEPWKFPPPADIIDREELGCDPLSSPPPASPSPPPDSTIEIQCSEAPLPPFYSLKAAPGQQSDGLWCLLQDITNLLQIKSKESLLKQIHCGSGSPKELLREIRTQEFLERAQCHQLLCAGEKVNVRASKVALVRVTDKLRQLLKVETVLVS